MRHVSRIGRRVLILMLTLMSAGMLSANQEGAGGARLFICPMHPDVIGSDADVCPRCGMRLVPRDTPDGHAPVLHVEIAPRALKPGEAGTLRIRVSGPDGAAITQFQVLHDRPMHVFLVDHDLVFFAHLHPEAAADGTFAVPIALPRAGVYHAFVEFMPLGGTPELVQRALVTAGWHEGVARNDLTEDIAAKVAGSLKMQIQLPADGLVAGRDVHFRCSITDAASGAPVSDLQPYLGTLAHLFFVSADLRDASHVHPIPDFSDPAGPNLVFEAMFPRAGRYRLWLQVQRRGELYLAPFTVSVGPG